MSQPEQTLYPSHPFFWGTFTNRRQQPTSGLTSYIYTINPISVQVNKTLVPPARTYQTKRGDITPREKLRERERREREA